MSKSELPEDIARQARNLYMREYNSNLSPEAKAAKSEYQREYRKRPHVKEKIKQYQNRYWERKAEKAGLFSNGTQLNQCEPNKPQCEPKSEPSTKVCEYCGKSFVYKYKSAKYCSDVCRSAFNKKRK